MNFCSLNLLKTTIYKIFKICDLKSEEPLKSCWTPRFLFRNSLHPSTFVRVTHNKPDCFNSV